MTEKKNIECKVSCKDCFHFRVCDILDPLHGGIPCDRFVHITDIVKVVHGEWVEEEFESYIPVEVDITGNLVVHKHTIYRCSICGRTEHQKEPYCHCGAKMGGEQNVS